MAAAARAAEAAAEAAAELRGLAGDFAERADFLAVLRRARLAAGGADGEDPDSEPAGRPAAAAADADANPVSLLGAVAGEGRRLVEAAREAGRLLWEFEREGVWLLLRADALAAARSGAEEGRAAAEAALAPAVAALDVAEAALAERGGALARARRALLLEQEVNAGLSL